MLTTRPAAAAAQLELDDLACLRGSRCLFSGVSVGVASGQLLRVTGANGAGKTSLLRQACGLLPPTRGEVRWRGQPLQRQRERFGHERLYLGHAAALKDDLSALENLAVTGSLAGAPPGRREALAALATAGLRGREHLPVRLLSQGQRRRAALARLVLAAGVALWVLDEPFTALDSAAGEWLSGLITTQLDHGGIVVLTSHQHASLGDPAREQVLPL